MAATAKKIAATETERSSEKKQKDCITKTETWQTHRAVAAHFAPHRRWRRTDSQRKKTPAPGLAHQIASYFQGKINV